MKKQKKIFCADFETITINTEYYKKHNDTKVFAWAAENLYSAESYHGTEIKDFINIMLEKNVNIVYFHNLSWDGVFIRSFLLEKGFKFSTNKNLKSGEYYFLTNNHKIYFLKFKVGKQVILFKCSFLILSIGIEALGKNFNLDKYENVSDENFYDLEPVKNFNDLPENFINYLYRDVEIMKKSILNFEFTLSKIDVSKKFNLHKFYTIAAISLFFQIAYAEFWRKKNRNSFFIKPYEYNRYKKLMSGGFSSFNIQKQDTLVKNNIKGYDINSSYPSVMEKDLPLNKIKRINNKYTKEKNKIYFYKIFIYSAFSLNKNVLILKNWNHKEYFTRYVNFIENVECWYFSDEWELIKKHYDINFRIMETYEVESDSYLKEYISEAYSLRLKNQDFKQSIKILLNSSFGTHAKKISYNEVVKEYKIGEFFKKEYKKYGKVLNKKYEVFSENINSNDYEKLFNARNINELELPEAPNIVLAAYITMRGRVNLINFMEQVGFENVLYFDTDSVYFIDKPDINNKIKKYLHNSKLGFWKLENDISEFYIKGSKSYYYVKKTGEKNGTYSGINKKYLAKNIGLDLFTNENILLDAQLKKEYKKSGIVLITKNYKVNKRSH